MVKEVLGYLHSHWDREWYKTFEEFRIRLCDVLNDIFHKLDNNEINSFYLDGQVIALLDYLEINPDKTSYVKELIKNKKLFIGPFYDLADEFLVNGESLSRNLLFGINEAKKLGADADDFVGYLPDAFGHNAWMPMLFNMFNIDKAIVWRGVKSDSQEFLWFSPDNSHVRTVYLPAGYFQDFLHQKSYKNKLKKLLKNSEKYTDKNTPVLLPVGGDHLACADNIKAKIKNFNRDNKDFHIKLSTLKKYFETTSKDITDENSHIGLRSIFKEYFENSENLPVINGELRNNNSSYILMGTASSRIDLKQMNMKSQWELGKVAEPLYTIFDDILPERKSVLDYAWKTLIKNHAHDSICGCSIDEVHKENILRYNKVLQITESLKNYALSELSKRISKNETGIINTSNFDYTGVYSFYSDKKLPLPCVGKEKAFPAEISQDLYRAPVQEDYHYYYKYLAFTKLLNGNSFDIQTPYVPLTHLAAEKNKITNEYISVTVNDDGTINIKNIFSQKEIKNIFSLTDIADTGDSYNFSCILDDTPLRAKFTGSKIIEKNQLRSILRLTYKMQIPLDSTEKKRSKKPANHIFNVDLILTSYSKRLDIKISYENFSKNHILKINFPLKKDITSVKSEDAFGITERKFDPKYDYKKSIPLEKYKEADTNTGIMQRFVMVQGLCIITKGLQEYQVEKNNLSITLLRSFDTISGKTLLTRTAAAGPPLPTPEGQMKGKQTAEISLLLTNDETEAFSQADFFYNPLIVIDGISDVTTIEPKHFFNLPDGLYVYGIKKAEKVNGKIVKIFNYTNSVKSFVTDKDIFETNLLEEVTEKNNLKNTEIQIAPNELKVFLIN